MTAGSKCSWLRCKSLTIFQELKKKLTLAPMGSSPGVQRHLLPQGEKGAPQVPTPPLMETSLRPVNVEHL